MSQESVGGIIVMSGLILLTMVICATVIYLEKLKHTDREKDDYR